MIKQNKSALAIFANTLLIATICGCDRQVQYVEPLVAATNASEPTVTESRTSESLKSTKPADSTNPTESAKPSERTEHKPAERPTNNIRTAEAPAEANVASATKPEKPDPKTLVMKNYTAFIEVAKFYREENATATRDYPADVTQMKKTLEQLESIAADSPEFLGAHEAVAEVAFELSLIMQEHMKSPAAASGVAALLPYTIDSLKVDAWKEFRKAASMGSQNAYTYDRLARLKLTRTGGRWEDTELVENILESMRLAPEAGISVRLLVLALLNSSFINSGAFDKQLVQILPAQKGNARKELERALDFLENEWEEGQRHAERAAILGHIDVTSQNEMMRNAKLKGMIRAALGIGPFERRNKSTAKK